MFFQNRGRRKNLPAQVFFKLSDRRLTLIWLSMIWLITSKSSQISPDLYHYQSVTTSALHVHPQHGSHKGEESASHKGKLVFCSPQWHITLAEAKMWGGLEKAAQSTTIRCLCNIIQGIMTTFPSWKRYLWTQRETPDELWRLSRRSWSGIFWSILSKCNKSRALRDGVDVLLCQVCWLTPRFFLFKIPTPPCLRRQANYKLKNKPKAKTIASWSIPSLFLCFPTHKGTCSSAVLV